MITICYEISYFGFNFHRKSTWKWLNHLETSSIQANWPWRPSTRSPSTCSWLGCTLGNRFRDQYFCLTILTILSKFRLCILTESRFCRLQMQLFSAFKSHNLFACSWLGCTQGNRFCEPIFPPNSTDYSVISQTVNLTECILADCKLNFQVMQHVSCSWLGCTPGNRFGDRYFHVRVPIWLFCQKSDCSFVEEHINRLLTQLFPCFKSRNLCVGVDKAMSKWITSAEASTNSSSRGHFDLSTSSRFFSVEAVDC